jgi:hypothetical protein
VIVGRETAANSAQEAPAAGGFSPERRTIVEGLMSSGGRHPPFNLIDGPCASNRAAEADVLDFSPNPNITVVREVASPSTDKR